MKRAETVFVKNNGKEAFASRYDGEDFAIPPGEICEMLVECAQLCLGFGDEDKSRCVRRLGWAFTSDQMVDALARLGKFSFHMTEREAQEYDATKKVSSSAPADSETPAGAKGPAGAVVIPPGNPRGKSPLLEKLAASAG